MGTWFGIPAACPRRGRPRRLVPATRKPQTVASPSQPGCASILFAPGIGQSPVAGLEVTKPPWNFWWMFTLENSLGLPGILYGKSPSVEFWRSCLLSTATQALLAAAPGRDEPWTPVHALPDRSDRPHGGHPHQAAPRDVVMTSRTANGRHAQAACWTLVGIVALSMGTLSSGLSRDPGSLTGLLVATSGAVVLVSLALAARVMIALDHARRAASRN